MTLLFIYLTVASLISGLLIGHYRGYQQGLKEGKEEAEKNITERLNRQVQPRFYDRHCNEIYQYPKPTGATCPSG